MKMMKNENFQLALSFLIIGIVGLLAGLFRHNRPITAKVELPHYSLQKKNKKKLTSKPLLLIHNGLNKVEKKQKQPLSRINPIDIQILKALSNQNNGYKNDKIKKNVKKITNTLQSSKIEQQSELIDKEAYSLAPPNKKQIRKISSSTSKTSLYSSSKFSSNDSSTEMTQDDMVISTYNSEYLKNNWENIQNTLEKSSASESKCLGNENELQEYSPEGNTEEETLSEGPSDESSNDLSDDLNDDSSDDPTDEEDAPEVEPGHVSIVRYFSLSDNNYIIDLDLLIDQEEISKPNAVIVKEYIPSGSSLINTSPMANSYNKETGEIKWLLLGNDVNSQVVRYEFSPSSFDEEQKIQGYYLYRSGGQYNSASITNNDS